VKTAVFYAGSKHTVITNQLLAFPVATPGDGQLDATTNQLIHYNPAISENTYLTNGYSGIFNLKSGGALTYLSIPVKGSILIVR